MNERLKAARKALHLTQREFGRRLGVQDTAISKLEGAERNLTDQMILAVCREFSIREKWLRNGEGKMFIENNNTTIAALVAEYGLDGVDAEILETYVRLPDEYRRVARRLLMTVADAVQEGATTIDGLVNTESDIVRVFKAAGSDSNTPPQYVDVPRSTIEKLEAAKDVDEI